MGAPGKKMRAECLPTRVKKAYIWCHHIEVIMPDCLSGHRGSNPRGIASTSMVQPNTGAW